MKKKKLLSVNNLNKSYGKARVLQDISLEVYEGEVLCLVGENGAGKSTIIKILSGAEKPDSGELEYMDKIYERVYPKQAINLGISTIYQDVDLVDTLSVADNIYLGAELKNSFGIVQSKKQDENAQKLIDSLNIKINSKALVEELSSAQKQNLQIIKALHKEAKVLIMDEPTASLGEEETLALMKLVKKLVNDGIGIIYISHYFEEIFEIGDRATVIKDGKKIATYNINECTPDTLINSMVGRETNRFFKKENINFGSKILEVKNFTKKGVVTNVSFELRAGEILGIGGLVGSGRTELVRLIYGADKKDTGELLLRGKKVSIKNPKDAINSGICLLTEDRKETGLFLSRPVLENISIIDNDSRYILNKRVEYEKVRDIISTLDIRVHDLMQEIGELSGGNQQKCIIARWLLDEFDIYIFDEPTKGVDIGAREEIYKLITNIAEKGKSIIVVSSDMPELMSISDNIAIMRNGELIEIIKSDLVTEDELLAKFLGV